MSETTDWGALYRDHVNAVGALAADLDDEQLGQTVVGTPEWTVRDVIAHLAGGPADSIAGTTEGAPGPEWTARHVAARADRSVPELLEELQGNVDAVAASLVDNPTPAVVWDIAVHHADLHETLGMHRLPDHFWTPIVDRLGPARAPELVGSVPAYELFRGLFSRRSRSQMQGWGSGADAERLDEVCIFGPREDDQPVPS